ncbi:transposase [Robertmurraya korlensis]|uniref:transposase n=1 Tax=Robertmurraya korlensis TaxID=519977 RepID=UPI00203C020C|nr:transposase [Robertmurraya korlensis]MCM3602219.1 transposase [Robertmurraya korlensis]
MPRKPRKKSRNGVYHIILRGINKQIIFEEDDDRRRFLETLGRYKIQCNFKLYGYCLMDNHVHLLVKEVEETVSEFIKRICSSYVYWYNMKYDRCGHLFQDRFKSEVVETRTYFFSVLRYIHQNPLKAGISANVLDSKWTSIGEYLYQSTIVDTKFVLSLFSEDREKSIQLIANYMNEINDDLCMEEKVRVRLSDNEVIEYLRTLGISSSSMLQQMSKGQRDTVIAMLMKLKGVSIRQISRVTGLSKSVVQRGRDRG